LGQDPDTRVEVIDGQRGELTVLVDGREVFRKGDSLPPIDEVKAAVAGAAAAGAR
jgi:hypothetical protein